jgi:hypothetical protein
VVNGEIFPNEAFFTLGILTATICRRVPEDATLCIAESALGVLFGKETFQQPDSAPLSLWVRNAEAKGSASRHCNSDAKSSADAGCFLRKRRDARTNAGAGMSKCFTP